MSRPGSPVNPSAQAGQPEDPHPPYGAPRNRLLHMSPTLPLLDKAREVNEPLDQLGVAYFEELEHTRCCSCHGLGRFLSC